MVYFIQMIETTGVRLVKIGTSSQLTLRLKALARETGRPLRVLGVMDGGYKEENALHRRFARLRRHGEWFELDDELADFIDLGSRRWNGSDDGPETEAVRIEADILHDARVASTLNGEKLGAYLSRLLRPVVKEDALEVCHKYLQESGEKPE